MTMQWWRCKHGAPFDPKWRVVALAAKSEPGKVWAVVTALYDRASQARDRGDIKGVGLDDIAEGFGWSIDEVQRIYGALRSKSVIIDNRIASWERHQPKRERPEDKSADRVRRHRERKKAEALALHGVTSVTRKRSNVTPPVTVRNGHVTDVTHVTDLLPLHSPGEAQKQAINGASCNATVTPRNATKRLDKIKKEEDSEANASGDKSPPVTVLSAVDFKKQIFASGVPLLIETDRVSDRDARTMIGMWRRDFGDVAVLNALASAQGNAVTQAIPYIQKLLANGAGANGKGKGQFGGHRAIDNHPRGNFAAIGERIERARVEGRDILDA